MMWYLGQPTRSGYNYDYDDLDEAEQPAAGSGILTVLLAIVFVFLFPYILLLGVIVYLLSQAFGRIRGWIESKKCKSKAQNEEDIPCLDD